MRSRRFMIPLAISGVISLMLASAVAAAGPASGQPGAVYAQSNAATGNAVLRFQRDSSGQLSAATSYPTGGLGTGAGLGSQGSVVLSANGRWLLAVDAGSDELSLFRVRAHDLRFKDRIDSGGDMPISVTVHDRLIYVVNAGVGNNISGFRLTGWGDLKALSGSPRALSAPAAGPAQIQFTPDGGKLVVTEKNTNAISVFRVREHGRTSSPVVSTSSGMTPFGYAFDRNGHLLVSEAFGGAPDASAVSSYRIKPNGGLKTLSPSVGTTQTAACWVAVGGRFAFVTNTGSGSVSSYRIAADGTITLSHAAAGSTGAGSSPIDVVVSADGRFLYALGGSSHAITIFRIHGGGGLTDIGTASLPAGSVGLATN